LRACVRGALVGLGGAQLCEQRVALGARLGSVLTRLLAVATRLLTIGCGPSATLGRRDPVLSGTLPIGRRARQGLGPGRAAAVCGPVNITRRRLTITLLGGLVAFPSRHIAGLGDRISISGCVATQIGALLALLSAAIASVTRALVHRRIATVHEIAIAGGLVGISGGLIGVGGGLVLVRPCLVGIGGRLVLVGQRLIGIGRGLVAVGQRLIAFAAVRFGTARRCARHLFGLLLAGKARCRDEPKACGRSE
jgi:hypothetical protein